MNAIETFGPSFHPLTWITIFVLWLQGDYDAGYLYECKFGMDKHEISAGEAVRAVPVEDLNDVPITVIRMWSATV
jgi:hypothetical protein